MHATQDKAGQLASFNGSVPAGSENHPVNLQSDTISTSVRLSGRRCPEPLDPHYISPRTARREKSPLKVHPYRKLFWEVFATAAHELEAYIPVPFKLQLSCPCLGWIQETRALGSDGLWYIML